PRCLQCPRSPRGDRHARLGTHKPGIEQESAVMTAHKGVAPVVLSDAYRNCVPLLKQWCHGRVDTSAPITVANSSKAAWPEHASDLLQRPDWFTQMHQHRVSKHGVEKAIGKGQAVDICNLEVRVRHPPCNAKSLCVRARGRLEIDADRLSRGDGLGNSKCNRTWTTTQVKHPHPGTEHRQKEGCLVRCRPQGQFRFKG